MADGADLLKGVCHVGNIGAERVPADCCLPVNCPLAPPIVHIPYSQNAAPPPPNPHSAAHKPALLSSKAPTPPHPTPLTPKAGWQERTHLLLSRTSSSPSSMYLSCTTCQGGPRGARLGSGLCEDMRVGR